MSRIRSSVIRHHKQVAAKRANMDWFDLGAFNVEVCPTPGKVGYPTRRHAKRAIKKLRLNDASPWAGKSEPRAFRCRCGRYHIGHLSSRVVAGLNTRDDVYGSQSK